MLSLLQPERSAVLVLALALERLGKGDELFKCVGRGPLEKESPVGTRQVVEQIRCIPEDVEILLPDVDRCAQMQRAARDVVVIRRTLPDLDLGK